MNKMLNLLYGISCLLIGAMFSFVGERTFGNIFLVLGAIMIVVYHGLMIRYINQKVKENA